MKTLKKIIQQGWPFLLLAILLIGYIAHDSGTSSKIDQQIKVNETQYNEAQAQWESEKQESIQAIEDLSRQNEGLQLEIDRREKKISTLQSRSAVELRRVKAAREVILEEKEKDEVKIIELRAQLDDTRLQLINQKKISEMWKNNYFREHQLRMKLEENYNFLKDGYKKVRRPWGFWAGFLGGWDPLRNEWSFSLGIGWGKHL